MEHKVEIHETIGITDSVEFTARTNLSHFYITEAERNMKEAMEGHALACARNDNQTHDEIAQERHASLYSIMLSVFSLEAHINMIGHDFLEPKVWEEYQRRSNVIDKWILFPLFIKGKTFDINSQLFKDFKQVIKWRNYLVHYKDYESKPLVPHPSGGQVTGLYKITNEKNARFAYETAKKMMSELETLLK